MKLSGRVASGALGLILAAYSCGAPAPTSPVESKAPIKLIAPAFEVRFEQREKSPISYRLDQFPNNSYQGNLPPVFQYYPNLRLTD